MNALPRIAFAVVLVVSTILFLTPPFSAAETDGKIPQPVKVVNTAKNPVPTVAQGTTTVSGNVNVTNNPLPISGAVNVANTPLPVSGSVTVANLPLDSKGNVLVDIAPDSTQYQYVSILAQQLGGCSNSYGGDFCALFNNQETPIEQILTTLSSQGYELSSVVPLPFCNAGGFCQMLYTLRTPVAGGHKKASQVRR
jgi:hypothetical protein